MLSSPNFRDLLSLPDINHNSRLAIGRESRGFLTRPTIANPRRRCCKTFSSPDVRLYELFGIPPDATRVEVSSAYRRLLARFKKPIPNVRRPSRNEVLSGFLAFEVLSNRALRGLYDSRGLEGLTGRHAALRDLLGESNGDVKTLLRLDLEEAASGGQRSVRVEVTGVCSPCSGEGTVEGGTSDCVNCRGTGFVFISEYNPNGAKQPEEVRRGYCPNCGGTGIQLRHVCRHCRGKGLTKIKKLVMLKLPPGIENGAVLKAQGLGGLPRVGGSVGDLYVGVLVRKHRVFSREGPDVFSDIDVPLFVAMLGGEIVVDTVWGAEKLELPEGTQHGDTIAKLGSGLRVAGADEQQGAHYFKTNVVVPNGDLWEGQEDLLRLREVAAKV
ncbi:hypothetical protein BSKO_13540 [Bryopsis sp. KO-2023]|nr:hypothetical protein BSKO_13540 [Bryopsis sp. KO-2023]